MIAIFANPARFTSFAKAALPMVWALALGLILVGGVWALGFSPADYQQGETARVMYIHVPAAWISMAAYGAMATASLVFLVWGHILADLAAKAMAPLGAAFTLICLVTGSLWGRPTWGTWWEWDGRMTSVLVLFFLYLGYLALRSGLDDAVKGPKAAAILCLVGVANLPIIHFSVEWWNSLHQRASVFRTGGPTIDPSMLWPLLLMVAGITFLFAALTLRGLLVEMLVRRVEGLEARLANAKPLSGEKIGASAP